MTTRSLMATSLLLLCSLAPGRAPAADHRDASAVIAAPETDLDDLYAWVSPDKKTVYLVMTLFPQAGAGARFSDAIQHVFHTSSRMSYLDPAAQAVPLDVLCQFDAAQTIQCWAGDEYVKGDASGVGGIASRSGRLRVFAGRREDPFFFNLDGFNAARATIKTAASGGQLSLDLSGCPTLPMRTALLAQLRERPGMPGSVPRNAFAGGSVLAIVVAVSAPLLGKGGPIVGAWAGLHRRGTP